MSSISYFKIRVNCDLRDAVAVHIKLIYEPITYLNVSWIILRFLLIQIQIWIKQKREKKQANPYPYSYSIQHKFLLHSENFIAEQAMLIK